MYELKFSYGDLDLEDSKHTGFSYKRFSNSEDIQTLTEMFNLGCDIDLEHSNPKFSPDMFLLVMIYHQIEFICKRLISLD